MKPEAAMEHIAFAAEHPVPLLIPEKPTGRTLHEVERAVFEKFDQFSDRVETLASPEEGAAMSYRLNLTDEENRHDFSAQILMGKNGYEATSLSGRYVTELVGARLFSNDSVYVDRGGIWRFDARTMKYVPVASERIAVGGLHFVNPRGKVAGRELAHRVETAHAA